MGTRSYQGDPASPDETLCQNVPSRRKPFRTRTAIRAIVFAASLSIASGNVIRAMQPPATSTRHGKRIHRRSVQKHRLDAAKSKPAPPPVPADSAPKPATIQLSGHQLTIDANNSDLGQILNHVARISGMSIEGLNKSTRIFGVYGPGNPSDILAAILAGSGYNFTMAGRTPDGVPTQLLLTAKDGSHPPAAAANAQPAAPNAVATTTPAAENTQDTADRENRMQQYMQRLQAMHEQQDHQNSPQ